MKLYFYLATVVDLVFSVACLWSLKVDLDSDSAEWSLRTGWFCTPFRELRAGRTTLDPGQIALTIDHKFASLH